MNYLVIYSVSVLAFGLVIYLDGQGGMGNGEDDMKTLIKIGMVKLRNRG